MKGGLLTPGKAKANTASGQAQVIDETRVDDDEGAEQATPEEQERKDELVKTAFGMMYEGERVRPELLKMLDEDPSDLMAVLENADELQQFSPVVALAAAAAITTLEAVKKTGETEGVIILHGGKEILEEIAEVARVAGIRDYSEQEMGEAMRMGADLFREAAADAGVIDLDEAKGEWDEIVAADKEGRLGEMLPQFANAQVEQPEEPQQGGMGGT